MIDLKLDVCGDLAVENGDFCLISGKAETLQRVQLYLKTFLGEYFFDTTKGVPYDQEIFQKNVSENRLKEVFRTVVSGVEGISLVKEIIIGTFDLDSRNISLTLVLVLDEDLEDTTLEFTGVLPELCTTDADYPVGLGDLAIWFDAQVSDQNNISGKQGFYEFVGSASKKGSSAISAFKPAFYCPNPLTTEGNCLVFDGTPYSTIGAWQNTTFIFVLAPLTLPLETPVGLVSFKCKKTVTIGENAVVNLYIYSNGATTTLFIQTIFDDVMHQQSYQIGDITGAPHIIALTIDWGVVSIYLDNTYIGQMSFDYWPVVTTGLGYLFCTQDIDFNIENYMNGFLGEFLYYKSLLSNTDLNNLYLWLVEKWGLS